MGHPNDIHGPTMTFLRLAGGALAVSLAVAVACSDPTEGPAAVPDQASNPDIRTESSELFEAVWRGQEARVQTLVDAGADVNQIDSKGDPVLLEGIWRGHIEIVKILVNAGADVNARDSGGDPILREAVWRGHLEIIKVLVDAGADVNAETAKGGSLLSEARWRGHQAIEQVLEDAGAVE